MHSLCRVYVCGSMSKLRVEAAWSLMLLFLLEGLQFNYIFNNAFVCAYIVCVRPKFQKSATLVPVGTTDLTRPLVPPVRSGPITRRSLLKRWYTCPRRRSGWPSTERCSSPRSPTVCTSMLRTWRRVSPRPKSQLLESQFSI